jgi:hypothetical protein
MISIEQLADSVRVSGFDQAEDVVLFFVLVVRCHHLSSFSFRHFILGKSLDAYGPDILTGLVKREEVSNAYASTDRDRVRIEQLGPLAASPRVVKNRFEKG